MKLVYFSHSLVSDWNHGNAHFLRGVVKALQREGHRVAVFEPADGWSRRNLLADCGYRAEADFSRRFPTLQSNLYHRGSLDLDVALDGADVVVVHEWNEPWLTAALARRRRAGGRFLLLFHDTHHRTVSDPAGLEAMGIDGFDGVLAFGESLRQRYRALGWGDRVWTWHEAADTDLFRPHPYTIPTGDLVWIGNWGDGERTEELRRYLLDPVRQVGANALVHGVRYPKRALEALRTAGIEYGGWIANAEVPRAFASHRVTVHVPRRPYVEALPGIPTIRVFEALACGIPLICAPWHDAEGLFRPGRDYLEADSGEAMTAHLRAVLADRDLAASLSADGLETVLNRHTCDHRAAELLDICRDLAAASRKGEEIEA